jgi:hypothetical protein
LINLKAFEGIYSIFKCISNVLIIYLCCILMYLNVFIIYFNVFQCISMYLKVFKCLSMYLNVFINIIIRISPSHFHYNGFAMCTHLYIYFSLSTMTPFLTCFTTTLYFMFHWSFWTFIQSMKILHTNFYFSCLYITPHSTFLCSMPSLVARSVAEPK